MLTKKEANALLAALSTKTVGEVLDNTDLINAMICLKQIADQPEPTDTVYVEFDCGMDHKVFAIKTLRTLTQMGLREAKDIVEQKWGRGDPIISAGILAVGQFEAAKKSIERLDFMYGSKPVIRWMVTRA